MSKLNCHFRQCGSCQTEMSDLIKEIPFILIFTYLYLYLCRYPLKEQKSNLQSLASQCKCLCRAQILLPRVSYHKGEMMYQFSFPSKAMQNLHLFPGGPGFRYSGTEMRNNFKHPTPTGWQDTALTSELQ